MRISLQNLGRLLVGLVSTISITTQATNLAIPEMTELLRKAEASALAALQSGSYWNFPLYMGNNYVAEYVLARAWFKADPNFHDKLLMPVDHARLREDLLKSQREDGSWQPTEDPSRDSGSLDATIMNYWVLKVTGVDTSSPNLERARRFVIANGGIEKSSAFTRIFLALFGQVSWSSVPWAPMFLVNPRNPGFMNVERFPQWVRPHIVPIVYLRSMRVHRDLGPEYSLKELHATPEDVPDMEPPNNERPNVHQIIEQILKNQNPLGSWGGYTSATIFSAAALDDYLLSGAQIPGHERIKSAIYRGMEFADKLYLDPSSSSAYKGTVCDGRYWDTILVMQGLASFDRHFPGAEAVAQYLEHAQLPGGGIPFGTDFESAPDVDDTAELITTFSLLKSPARATATERAVHWINSMQNSDGGWGAFDRNNTGNFVLRLLTRGFEDSATMFDPSTPDVTGHALEALGSVGTTMQNSPVVRRAVEYLRSTVSNDGTWAGRWGVNYIYGTSAAISGLLKAGVDPAEDLIQNGVRWIERHQNPDGGFGESTESYRDSSLAGRGVSTASQTAWALMALVRAGRAGFPAAENAATYLQQTASPEGRWQDQSVVGTGHSGLVYLAYPSYPVAFPMIALSEYVKSVSEQNQAKAP